MNKGPNPTSLARQHSYEITFSLTNPTVQGARHVADGQGRFVGTPYDSSDLEAACLTLARAAPTDPLRDEYADRLRRFIGRAEKLLDKKMARPGFLFPSLRMTEGAVNAEEIKEQIGEEWDAVALRLRPFVNQELQGEHIINIVTGAWRQHPEVEAIKQTLRRYYLLEAAARYRDLYLYRRGDVFIIASAFKNGAFEASGERGSFLHTNFFFRGAEEDTTDDRRRLEEFINDPNGGFSRRGRPVCLRRLQGDERQVLRRVAAEDRVPRSRRGKGLLRRVHGRRVRGVVRSISIGLRPDGQDPGAELAF
jgi:hypothetical protein